MKVSSQSPSVEEWVVSNITDTRFTVKNLVNFTEYEMSVRAVSPAGEGPWSEPFRGMTFEEGENFIVTQGMKNELCVHLFT